MLPVLQIGPLAIQTALLGTILSVWVGLAVSARLAQGMHLDGDHLYNGGMLGLIAMLAGARVAHVLAYWPEYVVRPVEIVSTNTRAFLWLPGLLVGLVAVAWYMHRHHLPVAEVGDAAAGGLLAASAIRSLANLLSGDAPGTVSGVPWAINVWGVTRHPSEIYEMLAALLVLAAVLHALRTSARPGSAALVGLGGYALSRLALEPFRAASPTLVFGLRTAQVIGLLVAVLVLLVLSRLGNEPQQAPTDTKNV